MFYRIPGTEKQSFATYFYKLCRFLFMKEKVKLCQSLNWIHLKVDIGKGDIKQKQGYSKIRNWNIPSFLFQFTIHKNVNDTAC